MTRKELRDMVIEIIRRPDKAVLINNALDLGMSTMFRLHKFKELTSTDTIECARGDMVLTFTFDLDGTDAEIKFDGVCVKDGNNSYPIDIIPRSSAEKAFPLWTDTPESMPLCAVDLGSNQLMILPPPNKAISLIVTKTAWAKKFLSDDSVNPVPSLDMALVYYACMIVYSALEQNNSAVVNSNLWQGLFKVAKDNDIKGSNVTHTATPFRRGTRPRELVVITGHDNTNHTFQGNFNL